MRRSLNGFQQLVCRLVFDEGLPRVGGKELISDYMAIMNSGDKDLINLLCSRVPRDR